MAEANKGKEMVGVDGTGENHLKSETEELEWDHLLRDQNMLKPMTLS
jgi:hypothetical protein